MVAIDIKGKTIEELDLIFTRLRYHITFQPLLIKVWDVVKQRIAEQVFDPVYHGIRAWE